MKTIRHNELVIGIPDDWIDASTVVLAGPVRGEFRPNLTITRQYLNAEINAADYARQQLPALKEAFRRLDFRLRSESNLEIAGIKCYQRTFAMRDPTSEVELQQWQVYVVHKLVAITITATEKAARFTETFPLFHAAIEQLKLGLPE